MKTRMTKCQCGHAVKAQYPKGGPLPIITACHHCTEWVPAK